MLMRTEFNLLGHQNPSFMLHFKPQFGTFSIRKLQSFVFNKMATSQTVLSRRQCVYRGGSESNNERLVQWAKPKPSPNQLATQQPTNSRRAGAVQFHAPRGLVQWTVSNRQHHRFNWPSKTTAKTATVGPHPLLKTAATGLPCIHVTKPHQELYLPLWLQLDHLYN